MITKLQHALLSEAFPDWHIPGKVCDECGALATNMARDIRQVESKEGDQWMNFESASDWRCGCDDHPAESRTIYLDPQPDEFWLAEVDFKKKACVQSVIRSLIMDGTLPVDKVMALRRELT